MVKGKDVMHPAVEVRMRLKGNAYEAAKNMKRENLGLKDGVKMLLEKLESVYKRK